MHVNDCFTCKQQHLRLTFNDLLYNLCAKYVLDRQKHVKKKFFLLFVVQHVAKHCNVVRFC